jgi:hypothetical protein
MSLPEGRADPAPAGRRRRPSPGVRADLAVAAVFALGGLWVTARLWRGPADLRTAAAPDDENVFEWFLAHGARWLTHGGNPLFSHQILQPEGANIIANTSILGLSVPLAPLTLTAGPHATFVTAVALCLAGTAYAWYHVLSRHLVGNRFAAFLGAAVCGFGPGMVAHAAGQLDLIANFLVPFLVLATLRLAGPGRAVLRGLVVGLLAAYQAMIAEEVLFMTAVTVFAFLVLYAVQRPAFVRPLVPPFLRGLGVAVAVCGVLLAYPLWFQFFGPRHASGLMPGAANWVTPVDWFLATPPSSIGGNPTLGNKVTSYSEYNEYFGWPVLAVVVLIALWRWRDPLVRALLGAGTVALLITLGPTVTYGRHTLGPGPYRLLADLPLFDRLTPSRFGLAVMVVVGLLVARAAAEWSVFAANLPEARTVRVAGLAVLCVALLPLVPAPLMTMPVPPVPAFVTSGAWRSYVGPGQSVLGVPVPGYAQTEAMRWSIATGLDLPLASGYMLGPTGADGTRTDFNPPPRVLSTLLNAAAVDGRVPTEITDAQRRAVAADVRYWRAAIVVVRADQAHVAQVWALADALFGVGVLAGGVWLWDVRSIDG